MAKLGRNVKREERRVETDISKLKAQTKEEEKVDAEKMDKKRLKKTRKFSSSTFIKRMKEERVPETWCLRSNDIEDKAFWTWADKQQTNCPIMTEREDKERRDDFRELKKSKRTEDEKTLGKERRGNTMETR